MTDRPDKHFAAVCSAVMALVALTSAPVRGQGAQPSYVFTDLGLPAGTVAIGAYSGGADVNNYGVVVGAWMWPPGNPGNPDNSVHGFKWDEGILTPVTVPAAVLDQEPFLTGCRPDDPATQTASCRVAVLPRAIDDIGRIAGYLEIRKTQCEAATCYDAGGWLRGFVMPEGGDATIIDCPAGSGCNNGFADVWGINIAGVVTGDFTTTNLYLRHGFRDNSVLDYPGAARTQARGINGRFDMDVVGFYYPDTDSGATRGYLFSLGSWVPIDVPGSSYTLPAAINDARDIVGTYADLSGHWHAFLWPQASGGTVSHITDGTTEMVQGLGNNDAGQIVGITLGPPGQRFMLAHDSALPLPGAFNKSTPTDLSTGQPASLTLSWGTSTGATNYKYCLETSINGNCDGTWTNVGNATSAAVAGLNPSTAYQWQMRAQNATGTTNANDGVWWNFSTPIAAPAFFSATAASTSQVALTWSAVIGATSYEVYRSASLNDPYGLDVSTTATSATGTGVSANTTYLYKVRAIGSSGPSMFTAADPATTVVFNDASLSGVRIREVHFTQLRTAVSAMRAAAALTAFAFTGPATSAGTSILRQQVIDLRAALDGARSALGLLPIGYIDPVITAASTIVRAAHITDLRAGTQ